MNWKTSIHLQENKYNLPGNWLNIEYFEAINLLFRIENSLRIFVYVILKEEYFDKWKDLSVTSDDDEQSTLSAIAKKRLSQDKNYAYLGYTLSSPILHLTSGELIRIITSDSYWKLFKSYFLGSREIIKNKLDEIGNVRNSIAHFRPVKKGDVELVKQNAFHTLSEIEKNLIDFISCPDVVPTNTEDDWYKELKTLGISECHLLFHQSKSEKWITITLVFNLPTLEMSNNFWKTRRTFNLKTDGILLNFPDLTRRVISVNERNPYSFSKEPEKAGLQKSIRFTFSKGCLVRDSQKIKAEFEKILFQISNEINLIKEDNLARGKLIEIVSCNFEKYSSGEYYELRNDVFETELNEYSPVEFWGQLNDASKDFITNTEQYPWMPVKISDDKDLPF